MSNLTPKEKAEELVGKYYFQVFNLNQQKQCALICVCEIINTDALLNEADAQCIEGYKDTIRIEYWEEVKKEIELL